jgi:uncharacterized phiE125 gp8 family phage protein
MRNLQVRIKTDITTDPVSLEEAKNYCKVTGSQDDALIELLLNSAREGLEKYTASTFAQKTIYATWIEIPDDWCLDLPYGPIISVDRVYSIDEEKIEVLQTLNKDYYVYGDTEAIVKVSQFWSTGERVRRSIRVEYKAGYGDTLTEALPERLREAILKEVATQYKFRDNLSEVGVVVLGNESKALAFPYRRQLWF